MENELLTALKAAVRTALCEAANEEIEKQQSGLKVRWGQRNTRLSLKWLTKFRLLQRTIYLVESMLSRFALTEVSDGN